MLFGHLLMRAPCPSQLEAVLPQSLVGAGKMPRPRYHGSRDENRMIDRSVYESGVIEGDAGLRSVTWRGAAGGYHGSPSLTVPKEMAETPMAVIGAGPSGTMAARALQDAGFHRVLLFDPSGEVGGIWREPHLVNASRANPFPLQFEHCTLEAAPGPGREVTTLLQRLASPPGRSPLSIVKGRVLTVAPGDLGHRVTYQHASGKQEELMVPIVVNALGVGDPLEPSRPGKMTTDVLAHQAGKRWQEVWGEEQIRRYQGKSLAFISLSNATFEMVKQVQAANRKGAAIQYHILTHYPRVALEEPQRRIEHLGSRFRLFRNPGQYELLRLAGDLPEVAEAFHLARDSDRIIPHITHWSIEQGAGQRSLIARQEDGSAQRVPYDEMYTLIGYGPQADLLRRDMGLSVNHPYLGAVDLDYDGEAHRRGSGEVGRERVWPGYFCLGIRNAYNQNEVLLPGIFFRLPDLVAGVILRAAEHVVRHRQHALLRAA